MKDRKTKEVVAKVVKSTDGETLQAFVRQNAEPGAAVYTDATGAYSGLTDYKCVTVKHSVGEYVKDHVHTNGVESFWSMLKRAQKDVYHKISPKHLQRYADEFSGRQTTRELDMLEQMATVTEGLASWCLRYRDLVADNGLPSGART